MKTKCTAIAIFALAVCLTASADQTFTGSNNTGTLSASATFTTSAGSIRIVLTNTLSASGLTSAGQALSDVTFTLSGAPGTLGTITQSGQLANLSGGTNDPKTATFISGSPTRWSNVTFSANTVHLTAIGGGQPSNLILPAVGNGGTYANANASLLNFNPSIIGPGTFTINLSGVTAGTTVSNVIFSFGTQDRETEVPGVPGQALGTPEPASMLLLGAGLSALGVFGRRKLRK